MAAPVMKRAYRGLYHGKHIRFGNLHSGKSGKKSRRTWKPNVTTRTFESETLRRRVRLNVTMKALRTIDKYGGFDQYILGVDEQYIPGIGLKLKRQMQAMIKFQPYIEEYENIQKKQEEYSQKKKAEKIQKKSSISLQKKVEEGQAKQQTLPLSPQQ